MMFSKNDAKHENASWYLLSFEMLKQKKRTPEIIVATAIGILRPPRFATKQANKQPGIATALTMV
jgi:hypothetical protein